MTWLMEFHHERRGILARYGIELLIEQEVVSRDDLTALLAVHGGTAVRERGC